MTSQEINPRAEKAGRSVDFLILASLVAAFVAITFPTMHMGIWLDEVLSINSSSASDPIATLVGCFGRQDDYHPPLFYMILNAWIHLFGKGDVSVKVPSLIFGITTIPTVYWLGTLAHSRRVGLLAALFYVISPLPDFLSCQCRSYALATLFSTIATGCFIKLQAAPKTPQDKSKIVTFFLCALSCAATVYSVYVGSVLLPSLGLAALLIAALGWKNADSTTKKKNLQSLALNLGALTLAALLFLPWMPSVLSQTGSALYVKKPSILQFPEVLFWTVMNVLPTHIFFGPELLFVLLAMLAKKFVIDRRKNQWNRLFDDRNAFLVLLCTTAFPCLIMGYITNWWVGYFRYIYPFCPAAYVLMAAVFVKLFWKEDGSISTRSKAILVALILSLAVINIGWCLYRSNMPNSGLYSLAQEVKRGKFDDTALIICPDVIGPTLGYYLPEETRNQHHVALFGFAKWNDTTIPAIIPKMAQPWVPDTLVGETLKRIEEQAAQGFKYAAIARDSDKQLELLSSPQMPRKKRADELTDAMNKKYRLVSTEHFSAVTEDVTVLKYALK